MFYVLCIAFSALSYLSGGLNGAIMLSKALYGEDIREKGSGNPGFTNFKRVYGGASAWFVMLIDSLKTVVPLLAACITFDALYDMWQFAAAMCGFFAMLGHAYPLLYNFKGGKAFITGETVVWFVDWRVGIVVTAVFLILLFTLHYMSVASIVSAVLNPVSLCIFGFSTPFVLVFSVLSAALLVWRHKANIIRLLNHEESKFYFKKKASV